MKINYIVRYLCESLIISTLLLINVVMGNFTLSALSPDDVRGAWSVTDRILDALTWQNLSISLTAGLIGSFLLWHIVCK